MSSIAKIGILGLVVLIAAAPLMACMLPSGVTTVAEKACCRKMAGECGHSQMPASHSCCKTVSSPNQIAVAKSSNLVSQLQLVYLTPAAVFGTLADRSILLSSTHDHAPPESPPSFSTVLRI